jgi:RHS repeat-associated protein
VLDQSTYAHSDATRYLGLAAERDVASGGEAYYHGDLIDSTMLATDADADAGVRMAYTAFGEVLTTGDPNEAGRPGGSPPEGAPRYLYAGGWGYESGGFTSDASPEQTWALSLQGPDTTLPPITLQHLGHRWYQPDSGRFVQRDPIGIEGGLSVYAYASATPLAYADPEGLEAHDTGTIRIWVRDMKRDGMSHEQAMRTLTDAHSAALMSAVCCMPGPGSATRVARSIGRLRSGYSVTIKARRALGADGGKSVICVTRAGGKVQRVTHSVIRDGEIVHHHLKY